MNTNYDVYSLRSSTESVIQAKTVKQFEIGLDEHWKHQECKYDFTANKHR
jgi:hypothetical protein